MAEPTVEALRQSRDKARTEYAHTKQRCKMGLATGAQLGKARSAYLLAQDEYRAALAADVLAIDSWQVRAKRVGEPHQVIGAFASRVIAEAVPTPDWADYSYVTPNPTCKDFLQVQEARRHAEPAVDVLAMRFDQPGDFAALDAARAWCRALGVSYGSTDRTGTIGLLVGNYCIAKWHNLTPKEKRAVDGTITGDARNGPLDLRINRAALARAGGAP